MFRERGNESESKGDFAFVREVEDSQVENGVLEAGRGESDQCVK